MAPKRFEDPRRIFINRDYWRTSERRRPILMQAWYAEFVAVLLDHLINSFPDNISESDIVEVSKRGAHDILIYIHFNFIPLLTKLCRANQDLANQALEKVKRDRNVGTHQNINNSGLLRTMFGHMMEFCDYSGIQGLQTFKKQCEKELDQLNSNDYGKFY
jgi:hypothetical protein